MAYYFPTVGLKDVGVKWRKICVKKMLKKEEKDIQNDTQALLRKSL